LKRLKKGLRDDNHLALDYFPTHFKPPRDVVKDSADESIFTDDWVGDVEEDDQDGAQVSRSNVPSREKGHEDDSQRIETIRPPVCSSCLSRIDDCQCDYLSDIPAADATFVQAREVPVLRKGDKKRVRDELETEYALWFYDTRGSYKPPWADEYLRLPPYQFRRASSPFEGAEVADGEVRASFGSGELPSRAEEEGPSPRYVPLSHMRTAQGPPGGIRQVFARERLREKKAKCSQRRNASRLSSLLRLYQEFQEGSGN